MFCQNTNLNQDILNVLTSVNAATWAKCKTISWKSPVLARCHGCLSAKIAWAGAVTWQNWIRVANCKACFKQLERFSDLSLPAQGCVCVGGGRHMTVQRDLRSLRLRCWYSLSSCR